MSRIFSLSFLTYDNELLNEVSLLYTWCWQYLNLKIWFPGCINCVNNFHHNLRGLWNLNWLNIPMIFMASITGQTHVYVIRFANLLFFSSLWWLILKGRRYFDHKGSITMCYLFKTWSRKPLQLTICLNPQVNKSNFHHL